MQRIASLFSNPQKAPSKLDVNKHADRQVLKRQVIDSKTGKVNYSKLEQLQQYYPGLKTLYLKKDWLGQQYVSFKPPRIASYQARAKEKLGMFINHDLMVHHTNVDSEGLIAMQKLMGNLNTNGGGLSTTVEVRHAVQTMAGVKQYGTVQQVALNEPHAPATKRSTCEVVGDDLDALSRELDDYLQAQEANKFDQLSTDLMQELDSIDSEPSHFKFDDPGQVTSEALDDFQLQLRKGIITRPAHEQVTSYVNELNAIPQGNSARDPSPSEVTRLLRFITTGQTESLSPQPMNQWGGKEFGSQYEAARFLYTETNFLEHLNVDDSEYHKGVFAQVARLEANTRRMQAAADLEENSQSGPSSVT